MHIEKRNTQLRRAILRLGITIWFLSTGRTEYRILVHLFGVSRSSVCCVIKEVSTAVVKVLMKQYIKFPVGEDLNNMIKGFEEKWEFPNCGGATDGSHIL